MNESETLKALIRIFTTRDWRCHRRRIFFEKLFEDLKEVRNEKDNVIGYIKYTSLSYRLSCHDIAASVPFYPFDKEFSIDIGKYFAKQERQTLFSKLDVKITRDCSLLKLLNGYGIYSVFATIVDHQGRNIYYSYSKKVKL